MTGNGIHGTSIEYLALISPLLMSAAAISIITNIHMLRVYKAFKARVSGPAANMNWAGKVTAIPMKWDNTNAGNNISDSVS